MESKICFEMSLVVVEAIRGRCASFMILTGTVSEICAWWTDKCTYFSSIDNWLPTHSLNYFYNILDNPTLEI